MKRIGFAAMVGVFCLLLASCVSPMEEKPVAAYSVLANWNDIKMEILGFKADTTTLSTSIIGGSRRGTALSPFDQWKAILGNDGLRTIGPTLENSNLAKDSSYAYFGIYSLQELELYKSQTRFVTFVEVVQNRYTQTGGSGALIPLKKVTGWTGVAGLALGLIAEDSVSLVPGGLLTLISALIPANTSTQFEGLYNIYIYDTETKAVVRKEAVSVNSSDKWKGAYSHKKTDPDIINAYYSRMVSNALLERYDQLSRWLNNNYR